jgi:OmpA-OmpF porin, OOP family
MPSFFKKILLVIPAVLLSLGLFAQELDSAYVEPFSKISEFRTWSVGINGGFIMPFADDFSTPTYQYGYGGFIKKQILSTLGIQADFMAGKVNAENSLNNQYSQYTTKISWSASLSVNLILANINWRNRTGLILPYLSAGVGMMAYEPSLTDLAIPPVTTPYLPAPVQSYFIPVAAGLKVKVAKGVNLDLSCVVNFVSADNFDGLVLGNVRDRFYYPRFGIEIALGSRDKQQLATHNPVASMRTEYLLQGQSLQKELMTQKIINERLKIDLTNNIKKVTTDSDNDGVADLYDKCVGTIAGTKVDGSGCPLVLPNTEEKIVYVTEADKKVVKEAVDNLEFDFNSIRLRPSSFPSLNTLAQLLIEKGFSLKLEGHTDNVGPTDVNLKFSKDRAEAIKMYLISRGVRSSKIEATGYGREQPIATNSTPEGRQQNRRVEFTLY